MRILKAWRILKSGAVLSLSWCLFFCFIVYNGHTLCLSNVISPINVSGKLILESASLYEDLTYCTSFVSFHIKCADMSIFLLRGMLNNTGVTEKVLLGDHSRIKQISGRRSLDGASKCIASCWNGRSAPVWLSLHCLRDTAEAYQPWAEEAPSGLPRPVKVFQITSAVIGGLGGEEPRPRGAEEKIKPCHFMGNCFLLLCCYVLGFP